MALAAFSILLGRYTRKRDVVIGRRRASFGGACGPFDSEILFAAELGKPHARRREGADRRDRSQVERDQTLRAGCPSRRCSKSSHRHATRAGLRSSRSVSNSLAACPLSRPEALERPELAEEQEDRPSISLSRSSSTQAALRRPNRAHHDRGVVLNLLHGSGATRCACLRHLETLLAGARAMTSTPARYFADRRRRGARLPHASRSARQAVLHPEDTIARARRAARRMVGAGHGRASWSCARNDRLSYGELERRATQLARKLRGRTSACSATIESACAWSVRRLIVTLYGILKAGGAYVPIEPTQPKEHTEIRALRRSSASRAGRRRHARRRRCPSFGADAPSARRWTGSRRTRSNRPVTDASASPAGRARLRYLHLGIDGAAQGAACSTTATW